MSHEVCSFNDVQRVMEFMVDCSIPYLIRFRQCIVEYLQPTNTSKRPMWNALKYASSFPVIFLSAAQRTVANDIAIEKVAIDAGEHPLFRLWRVDYLDYLPLLGEKLITQINQIGCSQ